jgi:hypothetical protein
MHRRDSSFRSEQWNFGSSELYLGHPIIDVKYINYRGPAHNNDDPHYYCYTYYYPDHHPDRAAHISRSRRLSAVPDRPDSVVRVL